VETKLLKTEYTYVLIMSSLRKVEFFFAVLLIIVAVFFFVAAYLDWFDFGFSLGSYRFNHWLVWIGSLYIALAIPVYTILKKRYPIKTRQLLGFHVFGNLAAFVLISIHFSSQISRPAAFYPDLGTGLAMFLSMMLLVATGFSHRFRIAKSVSAQTHRLIHVGLATSFYLIIGIHILQGLGFL
jgi:carbon starvation protein CstA